MALSLFTCDLGIVFELVGATSACAMAYILPPLCYVKLAKRRTWETVSFSSPCDSLLLYRANADLYSMLLGLA